MTPTERDQWPPALLEQDRNRQLLDRWSENYTPHDSWQARPSISTLAPLDWANGENLYVVWADDNGTGRPKATSPLTTSSLTPLPAAPFGITATQGGDAQVSLAWLAYPTATGYNVKRSTTPGGSPPGTYVTLVSGTTDTTYTDSAVVNGTTYYYVVSAHGPRGETANSVEVSATPSGVNAASRRW